MCASNQWKDNFPLSMSLVLPRTCDTFLKLNFCPLSRRYDPGQPRSGNAKIIQAPWDMEKAGEEAELELELGLKQVPTWSWRCVCHALGCPCWAQVTSLPSLNSCSECNYEQMGKWHNSTANELPYWGRGQYITLLYFRLLIIILRVWCFVFGFFCCCCCSWVSRGFFVCVCLFIFLASIIISHLWISNSFGDG